MRSVSLGPLPMPRRLARASNGGRRDGGAVQVIRSVAGRRDRAHSGGLGITLGHPLLLSEPHAKERGKVMGALKTAAGLQGRVLALFAKTWGSSGDDQEVEEEFRHEARPSNL